jgi:type II secretory pathway component PulJ
MESAMTRRWLSSGSLLRFRSVDRHNDAGTTMAEVVVGMTIMAVFMTMFTTSVLVMYRSINRVTSASETASQLNVAFVRMDKQVRYATAISTPGTTSTGWYVELQTTTTGATVCTQFRVNSASQQLQRRQWTVVNGTATTLTSWLPSASFVTNGAVISGSTNQPFVLRAPDTTVNYQQLTVRLVVTSGTNGTATTTISTVTYTALNSTVNTIPSGICAEVARP